MADIVARVHVSRGVLYEYFDGVPGCLQAAHGMVADCILDLVSSACAQDEAWSVRLRRAIDGVLEFLAEEPAFAHLLGPEAAVALPAVARARERLISKLADSGAERHSVEGALVLVSGRAAAGEGARLPDLAPQLAELIAAAAGPGRRRRGAPAM